MTSGQDYTITAITNSTEPAADNTDWKRLSNPEWTGIYSDEYVSGFSDLLFVINNASARVIIRSDWTFYYEAPTSESCDWQAAYENRTISIPVLFNSSENTFIPAGLDNYRIIHQIANASNYSLDLQSQWPKFSEVKVPARYLDQIDICDGTGWLAKPTNASLHVNYAFARIRPYASKVQLGLPFLATVIVANILKVIAIFLTIRNCSSGHIITVGDAIATFLRAPEATTVGKCMFSQRELTNSEESWPRPWHLRRKQIMSILGGKRAWTSINL